MKTKLTLLLLTSLLMAAARPCLAMMSIEFVSPQRAQELGLTVQAQANGPNEVWVELSLSTNGPLKNFSHVNLEIAEGGTPVPSPSVIRATNGLLTMKATATRMQGEKFLLGYTPLQARSLGGDKVAVSFLANRAYLDKVTLRVVTGFTMNYTGHDLRLTDFVDLKKLDQPPPQKTTVIKAGSPAATSP